MFTRATGGRVRLLCFAIALVALIPVSAPSLALATPEHPGQKGSGPAEGALLVALRPGVNDADAVRLLGDAGGTVIGNLDELGVRVVEAPARGRAQLLARLARDSRVVRVEEDATAQISVQPTDPQWSKQWGPRKVRAPEAWDVTLGAPSAVIAVVDTGVYSGQPDLRGRVLPGWDFHNNDSNPTDDNGHGTAVAGVAAAAGNNDVGIAGMCWRCRILPVKVLNSNGSGTHSNIAAGVIWAADNGADVINLSIAGPRATTTLESAIAYARGKGVVVVGAAGNEGTTRKFYPAAYPGVLSVGASKGTDRLYSWSNRGSWVKLAAPGCAYTSKPRSAWSWWCGTSFATPAVAGTAALMKSVQPNLTRAKIEKKLLGTAVAIPKVSRGRIDAARAVRAAAAAATSSPSPTPPPATPRPTASPTPSPVEEQEWRGSLSENDHVDSRSFWLAGPVRVDVDWLGDHDLWVRVRDSSGNTLVREVDDDGIGFDIGLAAGQYRFTVGQWSDSWTEYRVTIEPAD